MDKDTYTPKEIADMLKIHLSFCRNLEDSNRSYDRNIHGWLREGNKSQAIRENERYTEHRNAIIKEYESQIPENVRNEFRQLNLLQIINETKNIPSIGYL